MLVGRPVVVTVLRLVETIVGPNVGAGVGM